MLYEHYPKAVTDLSDLETAIEKYLLSELAPPHPIVSRTSRIRTLGSCFAQNIAQHFSNLGYQVVYTPVREAINSPLANAALFRHVLNPNAQPLQPEHAAMFPPSLCSEMAKSIMQDDLFILTLGLSYCWYRKGQKIPAFEIQNAREAPNYDMRFVGVDENFDAIKRIIAALRKLNSRIKIVFTVSPVPLGSSHGIGSAVVADALSKSALCVAAARIRSENIENVFYWPSFEIVRWLGPHIAPSYGAEDGNLRHVNEALVSLIVKLFAKYFVGSA